MNRIERAGCLIMDACATAIIAATAAGMHLQSRGEVADLLAYAIIGMVMLAGFLGSRVAVALYCRGR